MLASTVNEPSDPDLAKLPAAERQLLESITDPAQRNVIACSLVAHRREDRLAVGDPVPDLELARLEDGSGARLTDYVDDRPLVLVFGSFT